MINLAGKDTEEVDDQIRRELVRARLEVVKTDRTDHEVAATLAGKLGAWTFVRAWYYWIAEAPAGKGIPIGLARLLHADPIGKTDVRVGGHCGCPSPDKYGATYLDAEGRLLVREAERATLEGLMARGVIPASSMDGNAYANDPKADAHHATVDLYHIDSEAGLRLFADALLMDALFGKEGTL